MNRIEELRLRLERATTRERVLLFATGVAALSALWYQFVLTPLVAREQRLSRSLAGLARTAGGAGDDAAIGRYAALKTREKVLESAIGEADRQLEREQQRMLDPRAMVAVLTDVLHRQKGLTLLLLENRPVEPLLPTSSTPSAVAAGPATAAAAQPAGGGGPYVHPVDMVLRGGYLDVLAYLQDLEAQRYGFNWRRFEFRMTPQGPEYRIEFTTVSMQRSWVGV
ncbi:MAG: hypothetical protein KGL34_03295 [Gammaproteobacteria bacterium]|nr:hypothetical protein [Gammaproteobacteria bacterium]